MKSSKPLPRYPQGGDKAWFSRILMDRKQREASLNVRTWADHDGEDAAGKQRVLRKRRFHFDGIAWDRENLQVA